MRKALLVAMCAWLIVGCSSAYYGVREDYTFESHPGEGLFVFSTRWVFDCPTLGGLRIPVNPLLSYATDGGKVQGGFFLYNPLIKSDFENPPGFLQTLVSKPGAYKISEVRFTYGGKYFESPAINAHF